MRISKRLLLIIFCGSLLLPAGNKGNQNTKSDNTALDISFKDMKQVASVDERFQSYNVEMAEVIGGKFWKPYGKDSSKPMAPFTSTNKMAVGRDPSLFQAMQPINLYNERLRKMAAALAPAYMRVSGTWANTVFFQDDSNKTMAAPPAGFNGILTQSQWKGVIDFSKAVDAKLIT